MAFRILELTKPTELHIKNHQLIIEQEDGKVEVPIEDLEQIFCIGADIRLSTMDLSIFAQSKIVLTTLDNKYLPTSISIPYEGNSRQPQLMHIQVGMETDFNDSLWLKIIQQKISNQARALAILGLKGTEEILKHSEVKVQNVDFEEAISAQKYFSYYHPGLNRRNEDPINSRLNYGYAIVRGAIVRNLVSCGFHPTFGIHHDNEYNSFNLADDIIEPWRPMVDILVYKNVGTNVMLSKKERNELAAIMQKGCFIDGKKISINAGIEVMCESLKRCFVEKDTSYLKLPMIIDIEDIDVFSE